MMSIPRWRMAIWPIVCADFLLLLLCCNVSAFLPSNQAETCIHYSSRWHHCNTRLNYHPAVEGWEQKYIDSGGDPSNDDIGPVVLSTEFQVRKPSLSSELLLQTLDVEHWPTWTTSDKEKWAVNNQVTDKEMPYGELSYLISGKLEIIPKDTGVPVIADKGDLVTFPKGFVADWKVLEELTWHYYLY